MVEEIELAPHEQELIDLTTELHNEMQDSLLRPMGDAWFLVEYSRHGALAFTLAKTEDVPITKKIEIPTQKDMVFLNLVLEKEQEYLALAMRTIHLPDSLSGLMDVFKIRGGPQRVKEGIRSLGYEYKQFVEKDLPNLQYIGIDLEKHNYSKHNIEVDTERINEYWERVWRAAGTIVNQ